MSGEPEGTAFAACGNGISATETVRDRAWPTTAAGGSGIRRPGSGGGWGVPLAGDGSDDQWGTKAAGLAAAFAPGRWGAGRHRAGGARW
ncbi:hypothetical protein [Streptomyces marincola]|uniref:hypothetical protein n=1 Tax=Streptomyces marincola TaxID=2878388 RepID=UPI00131CB463|nr:hypothetical protein [Streptomyces marincola]